VQCRDGSTRNWGLGKRKSEGSGRWIGTGFSLGICRITLFKFDLKGRGGESFLISEVCVDRVILPRVADMCGCYDLG